MYMCVCLCDYVCVREREVRKGEQEAKNADDKDNEVRHYTNFEGPGTQGAL